MSWLKHMITPPRAPARTESNRACDDAGLLRDALVTMLEALRAEAKPPSRAAYDHLISSLGEDNSPDDLIADIHEVLARRSAGPSAFTGAGDAREYADMARNLAMAMRRSTIPDARLVIEIEKLEANIPRNIGPEEARRVAFEARKIDTMAEDIRKRALEDRVETRNLARELDTLVTRLHGEPATPAARDKDLAAARALVTRLSSLVDGQDEALVDVRSRAAMDPLTEVCHRGTFDAALYDAVERAKNINKPLSLLIGDLDHFTAINERWGHDFGDALLVTVAQQIREQIRDLDLIARVGGETFAILLPGAPTHVAIAVAERIRLAISNRTHPTAEGPTAHLSMSIGAATLHAHEVDSKIYMRADRALQQAKANGRDQAILAV
jgi:diguanylate cyclase (GGDEF)-like protein